MEEMRRLTDAEKDESLRLSEFAFQFEIPPEERAARLAEMNPEYTWGTFRDGSLLAKVGVLPLHTYVGGVPFTMGGVAGVATWPEYRRGGLIARMLAHSLEDMKRQGQTLSFLHPFSFAFYRKFGWETYVATSKYEVEAVQLPKIGEAGGSMRRIEADGKTLQAVYEPYAKRYNGMLARDEDWWNKQVFRRKKGQIALCTGSDGRPAGYLIYQVKNSEMTIHEWAALTEEATRTMWRFVANHDSMIRKVVMTAPVDDPLAFRLDNPRIKHEIVPYFMARIVDLQGFVERYPFKAAERATVLRLEVADPLAAWNRGGFLLEIPAEGAARIRQADGPDSHAGTLRTDIQTLSSWFLGFQRADALFDMERLQGDREAALLLQSRLDARTPYLADFF